MMIDVYDFCAKSSVIRAIFMALLPLTVVLASLSSFSEEGWRAALASLGCVTVAARIVFGRRISAILLIVGCVLWTQLFSFLALQIGGPKVFRSELEKNFEKRLEDRIAVVLLSSELRIGLPQKNTLLSEQKFADDVLSWLFQMSHMTDHGMVDCSHAIDALISLNEIPPGLIRTLCAIAHDSKCRVAMRIMAVEGLVRLAKELHQRNIKDGAYHATLITIQSALQHLQVSPSLEVNSAAARGLEALNQLHDPKLR